MEFVKKATLLLKNIEPELNQIRSFPLDKIESETFIPVLKSAFTKCYDYCKTAAKTPQKKSFVIQPFLRGICEDLITLKYISKHIKAEADRNLILSLFSAYLQFSSIRAQQVFFADVKTIQIALSLKEPDAVVSDIETKLKAFWRDQGQNPNKIFPSIEHMAIDAGLKSLYDFLYHATSKTVHFSPNILLRLGWFKNEASPIVFSYKNFRKYYYYFNNYYGLFLFVTFSKTFKKELGLTRAYLKEINEIQKVLDDLEFYPELVTYEEMNKKRPSGFISYLAKLAKEEIKK